MLKALSDLEQAVERLLQDARPTPASPGDPSPESRREESVLPEPVAEEAAELIRRAIKRLNSL